MRKAWLAAAAVIAVGVSGCVVVVGDGDHSAGYSGFGGSVTRHLDHDRDFEFLGGDVNISGRLGGDVELVAGDVDINGMAIGGSVEVAAGDVNLSRRVDKHVEIAGGDDRIDAYVGESLEVAAGDLAVAGRVAGDAGMAAGELFASAIFERDVMLSAARAEMAGEARGYFTAAVPQEGPRRMRGDRGLLEISGALRQGGQVCAVRVVIHDGAEINGPLEVWADTAPEIAPGAAAPNIVYTERAGRDCDRILDL